MPSSLSPSSMMEEVPTTVGDVVTKPDGVMSSNLLTVVDEERVNLDGGGFVGLGFGSSVGLGTRSTSSERDGVNLAGYCAECAGEGGGGSKKLSNRTKERTFT